MTGAPRHRRRLCAVLIVSALAACVLVSAAWALPTAASHRGPLDVRLFARVPSPGLPEGIAVKRNRRVFVGTSPKDALGTDGKPPSKVFAYSRRGKLRKEFVIEGQDRSNPSYGLYGMAFDRRWRLYAVDAAPPRIVRLNPKTGAQRTYATFPDVRPCPVAGSSQCSDTLLDRPPFPNYPVFAPDGTMYVTDNAQALIWRVPPGGGQPEVWFTHSGLESAFGPNGIGLLPDRRALMFVLTNEDRPGPPDFPAGLYTLPIQGDGTAGEPHLFWETSSFDAPDGFAMGRSGRIYLALAALNGSPGLAVISPQGQLLARVPESAEANSAQEVPFDAPANVAFLRRRALVTNHAFITRNREHYAVLDVFAGERGLPLVRPRVRSR
jgi:sugar lactone lactonase YvrE